MRKFTFAFLGLLMSVLLVFSVSAVAVTRNRIYRNEEYIYEITEDNTVMIHYYIGSESMVTVPASIDGLPVKVIGERAFYGSEIKAAVISEGIEVLMDEAFFYCYRLEEVTLPSSLETVGFGVFRDCASLRTARFSGDNDSAVGGYMFYGCSSLANVTLPVGTSYIPMGTFSYCQSLSEITLPNCLYTIDEYAFYSSGLVWVKLPISLQNINKKAFAQSVRLESIIPSYADSAYSYIAEDAFDGCPTKLPSGSFDNNTDPTEPTDNVPSFTDPAPPIWVGPDYTEDPGDIGEVVTTDEYEPTTEETQPSVPESTVTRDGYYMGNSQEFLDWENEKISSTNDLVEKRKEELLSLAWNVRTLGDSNRDFSVNIKDATNIQKFAAQLINEADPNFDYKNSDVDTDGQVTVRDATQIQKFIAGMTSSL